MKALHAFWLNVIRWGFFALWSFFWMSAAILCRLLVVRDDNVPLSWARRFWGSGLMWMMEIPGPRAEGFVPQPGQPYIFAMNHQSMYDIVVAFVAIPVNIRFVAKKILRAIPFLGWYMMAVGMIFVDRRRHQQAVQSLDEACAKVRAGTSVLVYPEGTRSPDGGILPFKKGPFVMAIQAGVPIVPVVVEGTMRVLPPGSIRLTTAPLRLVLGAPIPTAGLSQGDRDRLMQRVRDAMIDLHVSIGGRGGDKSQAIALPEPEVACEPERAPEHLVVSVAKD